MASENFSRLSDISSLEELLNVQKKEKKELLAKTQKMKHGVPKGDKKKKKEVTSEITQLLAELDLKHDAELKEFQSSNIEELNGHKESNVVDSSEGVLDHGDVQNGDINGTSTQRVSKAQKRRNKKAALAKVRNQAIEDQELENLTGLRHLENEQIKKKLLERNLAIYEIPSDGNCLYKAIEHQLSILNLTPMTVSTIREETSKYMLSHMENYMPFLTCPETGDTFNEEMFVKYCEDIAKTTAWGGHIELQVISNIIGLPIEIIHAQGSNIVIESEKGKSNPKLTLSYHRHVFGLGEHYNSVISAAE